MTSWRPSDAAGQPLSRRTVLLSAATGAACALLPRGAVAEEVESHGLSTFGDLKYAEGFSAFEYVDPDAPKGGIFSEQVYQLVYNQNFNTFDSLHIYSLRGQGAAGIGGCFASLMTSALDEPDSMYGLAATSVRVSPDRLTYRFRLQPDITFHDGTPITAEDCAFSFNTLKTKGHPFISQPLQSFKQAVAEGPRVVQIDLAPTRGRDLPLLVASLPIFSRRWWESRDFEASSLERPLGSGPYRVGRFDVGKFIEIERVPDWWGHRLPTGVGVNNFDVMRFEYFRDRDVAFEAFKARVFLFREETTSRFWATGYDFPAAKDGRVKREDLPDHTPSGAQGWFFNTRREKFRDPRVRKALSHAFDFEWTNKNIMFGFYDRTVSFFQNSDLMATGKPAEAELALLEPFRASLPAEVFGDAVMPPRSDGSGEDRKLLREATRLLREAGWSVQGGSLRNGKGEAFTIEFLDDDNSLERHTAPLIKNLSRLGIGAAYRVVDSAQLQARMDAYDFDMLVRRHTMGATPGEDLRGSFSSKAAAMKGTYNLAGIADPAVDGLIETIIGAQTREALTIACRALDRILRAGHYWIPQWYKASHWLAYWNVYDHPVTNPRYGRGVPDIWWWKG